MPDRREGPGRWSILLPQAASIALMWAFLGAVVSWIVNLVFVARALGDPVDVSVALCAVAVCVYTLVAGVLTWVFFGLRRGRRRAEP